jgi:hypothetical protein
MVVGRGGALLVSELKSLDPFPFGLTPPRKKKIFPENFGNGGRRGTKNVPKIFSKPFGG